MKLRKCKKCGTNFDTLNCLVCARVRSAKWAVNNPLKCSIARNKWKTNNPKADKECKAIWQKEHPAIGAAKTKRYLTRRIQAMPIWANNLLIKEFYLLAEYKTKTFGFAWHVDHIVPLKGKTVCGLHVEYNLQVIPGKENCSKSNRYWPDMPEPGIVNVY